MQYPKENNLKTIFLDLDGVVVMDSSNFCYFDKKCCNRIKKIMKETGAKIVVSSVWRLHHKSLESLQKLMSRGYEIRFEEYVKRSRLGFFDPEDIIDMTPDLNIEKTEPGIPYGRGCDITAWLSLHPEVTNYVVLDDDIGDIPPHLDKHVHTDSHKGITNKDVEKAIKILNAPVAQHG